MNVSLQTLQNKIVSSSVMEGVKLDAIMMDYKEGRLNDSCYIRLKYIGGKYTIAGSHVSKRT